MDSKRADGQHWSIRAEFVVSPYPQNNGYSEKKPTTDISTVDTSGVRLCYNWRSYENISPVITKNYRSTNNVLCKPAEYHKGSLTFTSIPCKFQTHSAHDGNNIEVQDSGYGSDLLSHKSFASKAGNVNNQEKRRCWSTCNIILSKNPCGNPDQTYIDSKQANYGRPESLNCQTLKVNQNTNFYGSSDPWCYHTSVSGRKDLTSICDSGPFLQPASLTFKKDVSIQTSDSLKKCSPANVESGKRLTLKKNVKSASKNYNIRRYSREKGDKFKPFVYSSKLKTNSEDRNETSRRSEPSDKSRTIHIDVYCTDSDIESETSSNISEDESTFPQTIYESKNVYVSHKRARDNGVPYKFKKFCQYRNKINHDVDVSENDDESITSYPSKIDSSSTMDFSSSVSSINTWKTQSLLSCTDDCDFVHRFSTTDTSLNGKNMSNTRERKTVASYIEKNKPLDIFQNCLYENVQNTYINGSPTINNIMETENDIGKNKENNEQNLNEILSSTDLAYDFPTSKSVFMTQCIGKIANRFGEVINISKKVGHHVGPTKNRDCNCDHCKIYFK